jgi:pimeloyl-ACP methyl ester carboxylesterase
MTAATGIPDTEPAFIEVGREGGARKIAVRARAGGGPGLFWLSGFNSDMQGTKALALDAWAAAHGRACVRFDYSGHGESGGEFIEGTIGRWLEESTAVFDRFCDGPQVVIGSSMGGWMALLLAREIARRRGQSRASLAGLVLIALWRALSDHARADRGGPQPSPARQGNRGRLPGAHPAGRAGPGRAVAARLRAGASAAQRRRGVDHDPGRRPPPLAAAGHRAHHRGG